MKVTDAHNERIAKMTFASVYPHYLSSRSLNSFYLFVNQRFDVEKRRFT